MLSFSRAGLEDSQSRTIIFKLADAAAGFSTDWSSGEGSPDLPDDPAFLKLAAAGLALAARGVARRGIVDDLFGEPQGGEAAPPAADSRGEPISQPPSPVAALLGAASVKRAIWTGSEAMMFPLAAPSGTPVSHSVFAGSAAGAIAGGGMAAAGNFLRRNEKGRQRSSVLSSALRGALIGGGISLAGNAAARMIPYKEVRA